MYAKALAIGAIFFLSSAVTAQDPDVGPLYSCTPAKGVVGSHCGAKCKCGVEGKLNRANVLDSPTVSSFEACRDACLNRDDCVSFGYTSSTSACKLTGKKILGQRFKPKPTQETFYNRHCFSCTQVPLDPPTTCGNEGSEVAIYYVSPPDGGINGAHLDSIKGSVPDDTTTITNGPGYHSTPDTVIYNFEPDSRGRNNEEADYYYLNHRTWFFAAKNGSYTITIRDIDDAMGVWFGDFALSGWTEDNALEVYHYAVSPSVPEPQEVELVQGKYYPIRTIFYNNQGSASFVLDIVDPDGVTVVTEGSEAPYFVTHSCDGTTAPPYPAYETET